MVAADVYRPAAITQLQVLGQELDMPVYTEDGSKDPVAIAQHAIPLCDQPFARRRHHRYGRPFTYQ